MTDKSNIYDDTVPRARFHMENNTSYTDITIKPRPGKSDGKSCCQKTKKASIALLVTVLSVVVISGSLCGFAALSFEISRRYFETTATMKNNEILEKIFFEYVDNETQQLDALLIGFNRSIDVLIEKSQNIDSLSGQHLTFPASSCAALPPSSPSGYYWVRASNGSAVRVYCDMTLKCGGVTGGWMRVAELDMTNSSHQCPSGLRQRNDSNIRTCVSSNPSAGCSPDIVYAVNVVYRSVCGRIIGYQIGAPNAFGSPTSANPTDIDAHYVDGVSITHGSPREHTWTFAAARDSSAKDRCPCINSSANPPPSFVGTDYFCDTGSETAAEVNTPPWFYRQLPQPTTDDIEMRVCRNEDSQYEDIAIEIIDFYVQ